MTTPEHNQHSDKQLATEFKAFIVQSRDEIFTDGMRSKFGERIHQSIRDYGADAVRIWEQVIIETDYAYESGEEFLREIGMADDGITHESRLQVLLRHTEHTDIRVRDSALLGLSFLDDVRALPALKAMCDKETEVFFKHDIMQVIEQLEQNTGL